MSRMLVLLIFVLIVTIAPPARGTVHEGLATLREGEGWDFSAASLSPLDGVSSESTDLAYGASGKTWPVSPWVFGTLQLHCGIAHERWAYDQLLAAPLRSEAHYSKSSPAVAGGVYVVITCEDHYAKFRVLTVGAEVVIEYAYQDDGSRVLDSGVPVEQQTWGAIKALFER